jgi:hypothetical protein
MRIVVQNPCRSAFIALLLAGSSLLSAQQIVQRGALGTPALVQDETEQWTAPLLLAEDHDSAIYMPDVSTPQWLQRNYDTYLNKGTYILTVFTFYRTQAACRANQVAWGLGDAAHLNACAETGYRARRTLIDPQAKSVTLQSAVMVDQNGSIQPSTLRDDQLFRTWDQFDKNTQSALKKADEFVSQQMRVYDARQRNLH